MEAQIAAEEAEPNPDPRVVEAARAGRAECACWREQLDPLKPETGQDSQEVGVFRRG